MHQYSVPPRAAAVRFLLSASAEPGLLPRVLQPFAKRDLIPERMQARREGDVLHVDILLLDLEPGTADLVKGNLGQIVGVHDVRQLHEAVARAA